MVKILREPYMKHNVTKLGEENESVESVLGNHLTECKLRHHTLIKANPMVDAQPELLQLPRDERNDCRILDMGSISITAQLDHG